MELALLVWLIGTLQPLIVFSMLGAIIFGVVSVVFTIAHNVEDDEKYLKFVFYKTAVCLTVLAILIPTPKTAQYMARAYLVQSMYQSEFINKATPLAEKAILNQLQAWAKDNPEVATLIENIPVVTNKGDK